MSSILGKKILITRQQNDSEVFAEQIKTYGAIPVICPLIQTEIYRNQPLFVSPTDWMIFTSVKGVTYFFEQYPTFFERQTCRIAVIGEKTKEALIKRGIPVHFVPPVFRAEEMMQAFFQQYDQIQRVIHVCSDLALPTISNACRANHVQYEPHIVYTTSFTTLSNTQIDWIKTADYLTATSPSTVHALVDALTHVEDAHDVFSLPIMCIGPTTEAAASKAGFTATKVPKKYTIEGMITMMKTHAKRCKQ